VAIEAAEVALVWSEVRLANAEYAVAVNSGVDRVVLLCVVDGQIPHEVPSVHAGSRTIERMRGDKRTVGK